MFTYRMCTFIAMSSFIAKHIRHFLKAKPTPSLKPPKKFEAGTSPTAQTTAPYILITSPSAKVRL